MRKLAREDYIVNSEEFRCFSRPSGDIKTTIGRLPKITPGFLIERYRATFFINENKYDLEDTNRFQNMLVEFAYFSKKVVAMLKSFKKLVESSRQNMNTSIANYKIIMCMLEKYEDLNLTNYTEKSNEKFVICDANRPKFKKATDQLINSYQNPYHELYHWIKGEIYDIQAMTECLAGRDALEVQKTKLESKKTKTEGDIDKLKKGERSMTTIMKKPTDATEMENKVDRAVGEIDDIDILLKLVTIHLGETVIPQFKREKLEIYGQMMQALSIMEINNAHIGATYFSNLLKNKNLKRLRDLENEQQQEESKS